MRDEIAGRMKLMNERFEIAGRLKKMHEREKRVSARGLNEGNKGR